MARVSIMGTGTMGSAIGAVVSRGGNTVELFGQGDAAGPISEDVRGDEDPHRAIILSRSVVAVVHGAPRSSRCCRPCSFGTGDGADGGDRLRGRPPRVGRSNRLVVKSQDGRIAQPRRRAGCGTHPALLDSSAAGLPGVLLADALVGEVAGLVGLLVVLAAGLLLGKLLGPVQRLIAALLALLTVQRVPRLVREASGLHAGLLPSGAIPPGYQTRPAVTPLLHHGMPVTCLHDRVGVLRRATAKLRHPQRWGCG